MNLINAKGVAIGGNAVKRLTLDSVVIWQAPTGNLLPLVVGSMKSYGLSVAVDEAGVITLNGASSVQSLFVRLTGSFTFQTTNTGISDGQQVFIPAGTNIRFGVEHLGGNFTRRENALNLVLRDTDNAARFNCMLGDDIWSLEGVAPTDICCLVIYIKSTVVCDAVRLRPYIEIL